MKIEIDIITSMNVCKLANGTIIFQYSHIVKGAEIGKDCIIGSDCYVGGKAKIGNEVRIQNGNNIWDYVEIGNKVFIAPVVTLTNDHDSNLRFKRLDKAVDYIIICEGATICTNSTIVAPCRIGKNGFVAAASIVLRDIKAFERVYGVIK